TPASGARWTVLFLSCTLLVGNYYAYDNPAALNLPLKRYLDHDYDSWQYELNLLYAVYSFPNMFLPFLGGQLVDRFDPRKILLIFSSIVCLGQTLFAIGVSTKNFGLMLFGRVLFGIGGESISVVQSSITSTWFQ
ncbi:major facilitator superfamily domain-containing protein, partial [Blyttiomyces helicus]